jgi:hypothetical protein
LDHSGLEKSGLIGRPAGRGCRPTDEAPQALGCRSRCVFDVSGAMIHIAVGVVLHSRIAHSSHFQKDAHFIASPERRSEMNRTRFWTLFSYCGFYFSLADIIFHRHQALSE